MSRLLFPLCLFLFLTSLAGGLAHAEDDAPAAVVVVRVPAIVGLTQAQAESKLSELSLLSRIEYVVEEALAADLVVSQDPASGAEILAGATIKIRISIAAPDVAPIEPDVEIGPTPEPPTVVPGPELIEIPIPVEYVRIPRLIGLDRHTAREIVGRLGLRFASASMASRRIRGTVLMQIPSRDRRVRRGTHVTVRYSDGSLVERTEPGPGIPIDPPMSFVRIPPLRGQDRIVARDRLRALGFQVDLSGAVPRPAGATRTRVTRTIPVAGMTITRGSRVRLLWEWVPEFAPIPAPGGGPTFPIPPVPGGIGRLMTPVPGVIGKNWRDAKAAIEARGLRIGPMPTGANMLLWRVRTQSRAAGSVAMRGTRVSVTGSAIRLRPRFPVPGS